MIQKLLTFNPDARDLSGICRRVEQKPPRNALWELREPHAPGGDCICFSDFTHSWLLVHGAGFCPESCLSSESWLAAPLGLEQVPVGRVSPGHSAAHSLSLRPTGTSKERCLGSASHRAWKLSLGVLDDKCRNK